MPRSLTWQAAFGMFRRMALFRTLSWLAVLCVLTPSLAGSQASAQEAGKSLRDQLRVAGECAKFLTRTASRHIVPKGEPVPANPPYPVHEMLPIGELSPEDWAESALKELEMIMEEDPSFDRFPTFASTIINSEVVPVSILKSQRKRWVRLVQQSRLNWQARASVFISLYRRISMASSAAQTTISYPQFPSIQPEPLPSQRGVLADEALALIIRSLKVLPSFLPYRDEILETAEIINALVYEHSSGSYRDGHVAGKNDGVVGYYRNEITADQTFAQDALRFYTKLAAGTGLQINIWQGHPHRVTDKTDFNAWELALEVTENDPYRALRVLGLYGHDEVAQAIARAQFFPPIQSDAPTTVPIPANGSTIEDLVYHTLDSLIPMAHTPFYAPGSLDGIGIPEEFIKRFEELGSRWNELSGQLEENAKDELIDSYYAYGTIVQTHKVHDPYVSYGSDWPDDAQLELWPDVVDAPPIRQEKFYRAGYYHVYGGLTTGLALAAAGRGRLGRLNVATFVAANLAQMYKHLTLASNMSPDANLLWRQGYREAGDTVKKPEGWDDVRFELAKLNVEENMTFVEMTVEQHILGAQFALEKLSQAGKL